MVRRGPFKFILSLTQLLLPCCYLSPDDELVNINLRLQHSQFVLASFYYKYPTPVSLLEFKMKHLSCIFIGVLVNLFCYGNHGNAADAGGTIIEPEGDLILVYYEKLNLTIKEEGGGQPSFNRVTYSGNVSSEAKASDNKNISLTLDFGPKTEGSLAISNFVVTLVLAKGDYWTLSSFTANIEGTSNGKPISFKGTDFLSTIELAAPTGMSFHCSKFESFYPRRKSGPESAVKATNEEKDVKFIPTIQIYGFQIQPFFQGKPPRKFGTSYDCVGFFSIGILSGIFINIILLSILAWGISMVMNVKTMDRFDDPKGKPISVGTE